ncbi:MAG: DUF4138 domain-containing protein [Puia sp.]|nr:DUF4138 domain-containing protein [Puia sp.]
MRFLILLCFVGFYVEVKAQQPDFILEGIPSHSIPVTMEKMTNLIFPVAVRSGIRVSKALMAQKVRGVENIIELKANWRNFPPTNFSVYGWDGKLYSFVIHYSEDSSVLNYRVVWPAGKGSPLAFPDHQASPKTDTNLVMLSGIPTDRVTLAGDANEIIGKKHFLHISKRNEKMRLSLEGIYLKDSLQWMVFTLSNRSKLSYDPDHFRLYYEDRKLIKRTTRQQIDLLPVFGEPLPVPGRRQRTFAIGYEPFTIAQDKVLVVEVAEPQGGRTLLLRVKPKVLLKAR